MNTAAAASFDSDPATTPWQQDVFVISALDAPPDGITGAYSGTMDLGRRYAQLRAANFTVVLGQEATGVTASQPFGNTEDILALAEAHDLRVLLLPLVSIQQNASVAAQLARSLTNSTSRALLGWHIADEPPDVAHFRALKHWKDMIDAHRPGKLQQRSERPHPGGTRQVHQRKVGGGNLRKVLQLQRRFPDHGQHHADHHPGSHSCPYLALWAKTHVGERHPREHRCCSPKRQPRECYGGPGACAGQ